GTYDGAAAYSNSRPDKRTCRDPALVFNRNGRCQQCERNVSMVMRCGTKIGLLGNDAVLPNRNGSDIVKCGIVSKPRMITDTYFPGKRNPNARSNENISADVGAKETPGKSPPGIKCLRRRSHKQRIENPPKLNEPGGPFANAVRQPKS